MPENTLDGKPNCANQLVRLIVPKGENYALMRAKLDERFKVGYINKVTYLTNLRKLNAWKMCNSGSELRKLSDYVTENLELLELAGGSGISESDILLADILAIIPKYVVNAFLDFPERDRNLKNLLNQIDKSASKMLEIDVLVPKANGNTNNNQSRFANNNRGNFVSRPSFTYQGQASNSDSCLFCNKNHNSFKCKVGTVQDRLAVAKSNNLCNNCLKVGHFGKDCRKNNNCNCGRSNKHCLPLCLSDAFSGTNGSGGNFSQR